MSRIRIAHLASAVATVGLFALISRLAAFPILDTLWLADSEQIYTTLGALSRSQLQDYRRMLAVDFVYVIAYAVVLSLTIRYLAWERAGRLWLYRIGAGAAVTAAVFDYVENSVILLIINAMPERIATAAALGAVTSAKWILVLCAVAVLLVSAVSALITLINAAKAG